MKYFAVILLAFSLASGSGLPGYFSYHLDLAETYNDQLMPDDTADISQHHIQFPGLSSPENSTAGFGLVWPKGW